GSLSSVWSWVALQRRRGRCIECYDRLAACATCDDGPTMNGVPQYFDHAADRAAFKRPAHRAGVELYRAHIVQHAFEPHTHDAYGLGTIEAGVERFRYRGADHLAPPDTLVLMNPDELHTGRAETAQGWRDRLAYL